MTDSSTIQVVVRVRPFTDEEQRRGDPSFLRLSPDAGIDVVEQAPGGRESARRYPFKTVIPPQSTQSDVFRVTNCENLVRATIDGFNTSVFAYGMTGKLADLRASALRCSPIVGSGKTYTMSGIEERAEQQAYSSDTTAGLIPRAAHCLFHHKLGAERSTGLQVTVHASFCEIYNENVFDLLNLSDSALPVRHSKPQGFYVQHLVVVQCDNVNDLIEVVAEGHKNRRIGSHELNKDSSRSHSILSITVST